MSQVEYVKEVSEHSGMPEVLVKRCLNSLKEVALNRVRAGKKSTVQGFFNVSSVFQKERESENGLGKWSTPARHRPRIKLSTQFSRSGTVSAHMVEVAEIPGLPVTPVEGNS
jgi:hypothetical protein